LNVRGTDLALIKVQSFSLRYRRRLPAISRAPTLREPAVYRLY
jgi:hypothetical protein